MATKTLDDAIFWNGLLMSKAGGLDADSIPGGTKTFPSEFPYEIDSPSAVLSFKGVTESGDDEAEEEDFLAELTRRLTRSSVPEPQKTASPGFYRTKPEVHGRPQKQVD